MKHTKFLLFLSLAISINFTNAQLPTFTHDCFSMMVGKDATNDGSVMFAHNEDDWGDRIVNWYKVPAMKHKPGTTVTMKNGGQLPQPAQTWSYMWLEMPEMKFSDSYMNEWGVTIGSDACLSKEKKPDLTDGGIGYWLRRAMAERATSARQNAHSLERQSAFKNLSCRIVNIKLCLCIDIHRKQVIVGPGKAVDVLHVFSVPSPYYFPIVFIGYSSNVSQVVYIIQ